MDHHFDPVKVVSLAWACGLSKEIQYSCSLGWPQIHFELISCLYLTGARSLAACHRAWVFEINLELHVF